MKKNNVNSFAFVLPGKNEDPNGYYKQLFVEFITKEFPELTIAGFDRPYYTNMGKYIRGIDHAGAETVITVGTAPNHDINWIERPLYALEKGIVPIYNLVKDFAAIKAKLTAYRDAKYPKVSFSNWSGNNSVNIKRVGSYLYVDGKFYNENFGGYIRLG